MSDEPEVKVENQTPSPEDYAALKSELEAERTKGAELVAQATKELRDKIVTLEMDAKQKDEQITTYSTDAQALQEKLTAATQEFEGAKAAYAYAVEDFKKLALAANPLLPPEVVSGTTVEDVKASLDRANALVSRVRESLQSQASLAQVPAGAPARTGPDLSALSTTEKLALGLEQARKKKEQ